LFGAMPAGGTIGVNYLQRQFNTYWVRVVVPKDVQPIMGKKVLKQTTGHTDYLDRTSGLSFT